MTRPGLLLDQMLDADVARELVQRGWTATRVAELGLSRAADDEILRMAAARDEVLVTLAE